MTLVLIVPPGIKNNGFCLTCVMSGIFLISTCNKGISFYWWIICFDQASQYPLSLFFASLSDFANLLAVLPSQKLDSDFGVLFTDPVASFKAFSRDITSQPLKNDYHFLLKSICFHFTGNTYYVCTFSAGILCVWPALIFYTNKPAW